MVDNSTATVTTTESGTPWSVDVTACNLSADLSDKDFTVTFDGVGQALTNFTKTTQTLITYSGASIPSTTVVIDRQTDIERVQEIRYGDRLQSAVWEGEFNTIHKILNEFVIDLANIGVGGGDTKTAKVTAIDTADQFLEDKFVAGLGIAVNKLNAGGVEQLEIEATGSAANLITIMTLFSDLAAVPEPTTGQTVFLFAAGYFNDDDNGGGVFYWDESDVTTTVDNGVYFAVQGGAGTGRWVRIREDVNYWSVIWYGIRGDAVTDNSTQLKAMRDTIIAKNNDALNTIYFPPSSLTYDFTENTWVRNIKRIRIIGYGATLRNTNTTSAFNADKLQVLTFNDVLSDGGLSLQQGGVGRVRKETFGFASASAGAITVTFTTPGDGSNFVAGEDVLITGRLRQDGGYPPNLTFFEYKKVASVVPNSITFVEPLLYDYWDDWYSEEYGVVNVDSIYGAAAITKADNVSGTNTIATRVCELFGFSVADNPDVNAADLQPKGIEHVLVQEVSVPDEIAPTISKQVVIDNCDVGVSIETDKLIENSTIKRSRVGGSDLATTSTISAGSGCRVLVVEENRVYGRIRIAPIEMGVVRRNVVLGSTSTDAEVILHNGNFATGHMRIEDNLIGATVAAGGQDPAVIRPWGGLETITVNTVGGGGEIEVPFSAPNYALTHEDLLEGTYLIKDDGTNGGTVTKIYENGGTIILEGTWETPSVSDVFVWFQVQSANVSGNTLKSLLRGASQQGVGLLRNLPDKPFLLGQNEQLKTIFITSEMTAFEQNTTAGVELLGKVVELEFFVDKIYTGVSGSTITCRFNFQDNTGATIADIDIDLKVTGYRRVHQATYLSSLPLSAVDNLDTTPLGVYIDSMQLLFREGAGEYIEATKSNLPTGWFKLTVSNPRANRADSLNVT